MELRINKETLEIFEGNKITYSDLTHGERRKLLPILLQKPTRHTEEYYIINITSKELNFEIKALRERNGPASKDEVKISIQKYLKDINLVEIKQIESTFTLMNNSGSSIELFTLTILKRSMSLLDAFKDTVLKKNYLVSSSLLRLQLDNCLRFYASCLVTKPEEFAQSIFKGKRLNTLFDRKNIQLSDIYLNDELSKIYPKLKPLYEEVYGDIHSPEIQVSSKFRPRDSEESAYTNAIGPLDHNQPIYVWRKIIEEMRFITDVLNDMIQGLVNLKKLN